MYFVYNLKKIDYIQLYTNMNKEQEYEAKLNDYVNGLTNQHIMLEVTKLCGYGCFMPVNKKATLIELYDSVSRLFEREIIELFFRNEDVLEKIIVPISSQITLQEFIFKHNSGPSCVIKPIYPVPMKVVYRLYFDDGHTHGDHPCVLAPEKEKEKLVT
jgi:hypothetical protein